MNELDVIDVGCGEGRFCRMLAERGARMIGIDPTEKFIAEARRRQPDAEFHVARRKIFQWRMVEWILRCLISP